MAGFDDFKDIRTWRGSQHSAWEELCYQLRDPTPDGARLRKTGNPDGGVEWYVLFGNGVQHGWQAKFTSDVSTLLKLMEESLKTVVKERPRLTRLTFCIPLDLSDSKAHGKSGWQRLETAEKRWRRDIEGAHRVDIKIWSAGDILGRLGKPEHRGRRWFFWDEDVFDGAWCHQRLQVALDIADDRYTPKAHVALPIARTLDALGRDDDLRTELRHLSAAVARAEHRLRGTSSAGLGIRHQLSQLTGAMRSCVEATELVLAAEPGQPLDSSPVVAATAVALDAGDGAWPVIPDVSRSSSDGEKQRYNTARRMERRVGDCLSALGRLSALTRSRRLKVAAHGTMLLEGDAGQGKTHLLCDSTSRRVAAGQPAALILAQGLSTRSLWPSIAENLGLPPKGADELLSAMAAAGEAADRPFVLHIDAINETPDAEDWPKVLPRLVAELRRHRWITCVISLRTDFAPLVLPERGLGDDVVRVIHRGFAGREIEALATYFDRYGLSEPNVPLLAAEFTNPLFLKLYCEGLVDEGVSEPLGHEHLTAVFDRYLRNRIARVERQLRMDPGDEVVRRALDALVDAYIEAGADRLARAEASALLLGLAPFKHEFPNTLLGSLLSEGVLTEDLAYRPAGDPLRVVRFSYQGLADHAIAARALAQVDDADALRTALAAGRPLRSWVHQAPPGWLRALSVQVPERFGVELLDAARWNLPKTQRIRWLRAFVATIPVRAGASVTARTMALLNEAQAAEVAESVLEAVLSVAAVPGHPLNSERLHRNLVAFSMPERDEKWSVSMYDAHEDDASLGRLIRWAARGPHPQAPGEVVELAAIPLLWMLTSPNRFARDEITKVLSLLLRDRPVVLARLVDRACAIDDPYVRERLAVVAHGALLCSEPVEEAVTTCRALARLLDGSMPSLLLRDAVRGAHEWAARTGLMGSSEHATVSPPYGAAVPQFNSTMADLEKRLDRADHTPSPQGWHGTGHSSLFFSLSDMGDFARYVVEPDIRDFSDTPLADPFPTRARTRGQRRAVSNDRACAWIFERVLELGWTPERFALIDREISRRRSGRENHKAERFGKKYQWIALRELVARISDNYHYDKGFRDDPPMAYQGPWQMLARDIDPTLRPCPPVRDDDGALARGDTFPVDPPDAWWVPQAPQLLPGDPEDAPDDWAVRTGGEPAIGDLLQRADDGERQWLALEARLEWADDVTYEGAGRARRQRHLWMYVYSWLCKDADRERLLWHLCRRSLIGQWMPGAAELTNDAYLAEMPWALAAHEWPRAWEKPERHADGEIDVAVLPAGVQYFWEGHTMDCSMEEGVRCWMPALELFEAGALRWRPDTREWLAPGGTVVAQYRVTRSHSSLLVDPTWLDEVLKQKGWSLVLGVVGEREFYEAGWDGGHVGGWTVLDAASSFHGGRLRAGRLRRTQEQART